MRCLYQSVALLAPPPADTRSSGGGAEGFWLPDRFFRGFAFARRWRFWNVPSVRDRRPTPLQLGFWLNSEEKLYLLVVFSILLLGIAARHYYRIHAESRAYTPGTEQQTERQTP